MMQSGLKTCLNSKLSPSLSHCLIHFLNFHRNYSRSRHLAEQGYLGMTTRTTGTLHVICRLTATWCSGPRHSVNHPILLLVLFPCTVYWLYSRSRADLSEISKMSCTHKNHGYMEHQGIKSLTVKPSTHGTPTLYEMYYLLFLLNYYYSF